MSYESEMMCMCGNRPGEDCDGFCKARNGVCECESYNPCEHCVIREAWEEDKWGPKTEDLELTQEEIEAAWIAEDRAAAAAAGVCDCLCECGVPLYNDRSCGLLCKDGPCGFCILRDAVGTAEVATAEAVAAEAFAVAAVTKASVAKAHAAEALCRAKEALAAEEANSPLKN